ncbi:MAG: cysteine desulfurase [Spirochaetales bacterium]|nr:cysteine desulfurase [Spirochaetales bacterium]
MKIIEKTQLSTNVRMDFPILQRKLVRNNDEIPLIYLDNAATTQKPQVVINRIAHFYTYQNANVHRAVHQLGEEATADYENARRLVQKFIGAAFPEEIVFTRGTTEALNMTAHVLGQFVKAGDTILISAMEHHSNLVPWQILAEKNKASLRFIPFDENGELILDDLFNNWDDSIKILSVTHGSNVFGTINPITEITRKAHEHGCIVVVDGAQSAPHLKIDVQEIGCDFYAVSGHKMCAPTGIGFLYGKKEWLEKLPPYQSGGEMIKSVWLESSIYNDIPYRFEAGTPNICGAIALGEAIQYLSKIGMAKIHEYERNLTNYALEKMQGIKGLKIYGNARNRSSVISFEMENIHPHDIAQILDHQGIAIRAGHHCAQPVMRQLKLSSLARVSFYFYNQFEEIDYLVKQLYKLREFFN